MPALKPTTPMFAGNRLVVTLLTAVAVVTASPARQGPPNSPDADVDVDLDFDIFLDDEAMSMKPIKAGTAKMQPDSATSQEGEGDPLTLALEAIITGSLSNIADYASGKTIIVENELMNNTWEETEVDGLQFTPLIEVKNDMHGSMHSNNKAESETGNVRRQNGVADFTGALHNNNSAESKNGDVVRENGAIDSISREDGDAQSTQDSSANHVTERSYAENTIVIRNKVVGNRVKKTRQNGIIVTPKVAVLNDMSNALYDNNNAYSKYGDVDRQNGVADFEYSLHGNNNAISENGDVIRQNGLIGGFGEQFLSAEGIQELIDGLAELKDFKDENFLSLVNVTESLLGVGEFLRESNSTNEWVGGLVSLLQGLAHLGVQLSQQSSKSNKEPSRRYLRGKRIHADQPRSLGDIRTYFANMCGGSDVPIADCLTSLVH